ncbi:MAG: aspartyl protease family protein, partial [Candidatus Zixiibacteriota bacterium]
MIYFQRLLLTGLLMVLFASAAIAQGTLDDPYDILNRYFEASGGLGNLKAERGHYLEGELSVAGLQGTIKTWSQKPGRSRMEADLGIIKMIQGDNGDFKWVLDSNGKLQKMTNPDEATIKRKKISIRMAEYEYADPESDVFKASFEGVEIIEGEDCYAVKIENNINNDSYTGYYSTETFLLKKSVSIEGDNSNDSYYDDYRDVDGLMIAFGIRQIMHQTGQEQQIVLSEYVSNPDIAPSLFNPPEEGEKDYRFLEGDRAENIPFQFKGNHLYIPVTINCEERYWILDTGAGMSVIGEEYANQLGLELQGELKGSTVGGTVDVKLATLPTFSIRGIEFSEQTVAVIDLKELNRMLAEEVVGILGFDFLSRFVTKVDYANELVSFYDPETFEYTGDGKEIDVHIKNSVFMAKATLDNEYSGTFLFDLGASSISLHGAYALKNRFTDRKGIVGIGRGASEAFSS